VRVTSVPKVTTTGLPVHQQGPFETTGNDPLSPCGTLFTLSLTLRTQSILKFTLPKRLIAQSADHVCVAHFRRSYLTGGPHCPLTARFHGLPAQSARAKRCLLC
jgi:hypothetical protein